MKAALAPTPVALELHNILFATDFSPAAAAALPLAAHLAQEFGAKLHAVHAKAPESYALPATEIWPIVNEQLEKESGDLKRALHEDYPALTSDVIVMEGAVIDVVETVAEAKHADLIILGTSGPAASANSFSARSPKKFFVAQHVQCSPSALTLLQACPMKKHFTKFSMQLISVTAHGARPLSPSALPRNNKLA